MSKELEAFRDILGILCAVSGCEVDINSERVKIVKSALEHLESIDNSRPSEALNITKATEKYTGIDLSIIKQALLKAQEMEKVIIELCEYCGMDNLYPYDNLEEIEITFKDTFDNYQRQRMESLGRLIKQKKVLKIIKEKVVDTFLLNESKTVDEYNLNRNWGAKELTQEEFDTLKEWSDND